MEIERGRKKSVIKIDLWSRIDGSVDEIACNVPPDDKSWLLAHGHNCTLLPLNVLSFLISRLAGQDLR